MFLSPSADHRGEPSLLFATTYDVARVTSRVREKYVSAAFRTGPTGSGAKVVVVRHPNDDWRSVRNWAGNLVYSTDDVRRPGSVEELQQVVRDTPLLRALGTAHSFSTVADTSGTLVSTRHLGLRVEVDEARSVAVVPGGATYAEVATVLHAQGWALHNLGSLPHISVAGACATGTHGSGPTNGSLATAVVGLELVRADGELVRVAEDHPDLPGMVVALGALGIVTRLWLRVEPTYEVRQEVLLDVPLTVAVDRAEEILSSGYSVSIFSSFTEPGTVDSVWRKSRVDASTNDGGAPWGGRAAATDVHPLLGLDAAAATEQLNRPGPWHHRLPHFREEFTPSVGDELQSEFFLPRGRAGEALAELAARAGRFAGALQVFEMRTVAADDLWLSPCHGRDTVAVHATWVADLDEVRPALRELEALLAPYDPRPHWGKVFLDFDATRLAGLYPRAARFRALAERLDPERCFVNDYLTAVGMR